MVAAVCVGVAYVLVWVIYRYVRKIGNDSYVSEHYDEHQRRAKLEASQMPWGPEELTRRADWDARHGPLMSSFELKNREESRWPFGAAFQGAVAATISLLIASLIWTTRTNTGGPPPGTTPIYITSPKELPYVSLPGTLTVAAIMLVTGVALLCNSKSRLVKATGATMAITASMLSGLKLLSVDKILSSKDLLTIRYSPQYSSQPSPAYAPFSLMVGFPSFPSGSADPSQGLACKIKAFAQDISKDPGIFSVVVVGRADRQDLSPRARLRYASNWGLAQQRGICIERILAAYIAPAKILVNNAGPLFTTDTRPSRAWEPDRAVTIIVQGIGGSHPWTQFIENGQWSKH